MDLKTWIYNYQEKEGFWKQISKQIKKTVWDFRSLWQEGEVSGRGFLRPTPSLPFPSSSFFPVQVFSIPHTFIFIRLMPLTLDFLFSFGKLSESSFFFSFPLVVIRFYRIRLHLWWCGMLLLLDGSVVAAKHSFVPIFSLFVWLKGKFLIGFWGGLGWIRRQHTFWGVDAVTCPIFFSLFG